MTVNRYKVLQRIDRLGAPWTTKMTVMLVIVSFVVPLALIIHRSLYGFDIDVGDFLIYYTYNVYPGNFIIQLLNIIYDSINLVICFFLSLKSAKLYKKLHFHSNNSPQNNRVEKHDDKLFMQSIFAICCLLIRLQTDCLRIVVQMTQAKAMFEVIQIVNTLLATIHSLGGSVFLLIISQVVRRGYANFFHLARRHKSNSVKILEHPTKKCRSVSAPEILDIKKLVYVT
uniref:Gustatory receptor n=1 Tax=Panagrolaimus sp. JU765 TaxID=591449 RepID=A0AC34R746_9BILA